MPDPWPSTSVKPGRFLKKAFSSGCRLRKATSTSLFCRASLRADDLSNSRTRIRFVFGSCPQYVGLASRSTDSRSL